MGINLIQYIVQQGIWQVFKLCVPILGAALIIGLIIAIFQATTSIQEQTLTFLPKLLVILLLIALLIGWMYNSLAEYFVNIINLIPNVSK